VEDQSHERPARADELADRLSPLLIPFFRNGISGASPVLFFAADHRRRGSFEEWACPGISILPRPAALSPLPLGPLSNSNVPRSM